MTALHWVTFNEDHETAKLLLSNGARFIFNKRKQTPVDIAGFCRLAPMIDLFIENLITQLLPKFPQYHAMHKLLDKCGDPNFDAGEVDDMDFKSGNNQIAPQSELRANLANMDGGMPKFDPKTNFKIMTMAVVKKR